jgi:peptidoglycan biosynthesis protein MviN/MurJ (putative lipid II flippase)
LSSSSVILSSFLALGVPHFAKEREMRERERAKEGRVFFLGAIMTSLLFLFSFSFCIVGVVGVCLEQGERPEKRLAVAAVKKIVGGENFIRNLN